MRFKQLQRDPPVLQSSSVHSRALDSCFLRSAEDDKSVGAGHDEAKKERVNGINALQQFVETASMHAIPDQDEDKREETSLQGKA